MMMPKTRHKTRFTMITLALCVVARTAPIEAQTLPDAATILDRYVAETGGRAAYETHRTEILTGTIDFPAQGLKGKLTRYIAPGEEYSSMDLDAIGNIETGVHGGIAWERSVLLGPRIKQGEEKNQAIREASFNAPIHWRELYPQTATAGITKIDGAECYEVILTPATGQPEHQFYASKTGLLVRTTTVATSQMGDVEIQVDVAGYKSFGGVLMPTLSRQRAGSQELSITVDQVRVNEPIPATRFNLPSDVAAILTKTTPATPAH
jgi:hypothetical protein